MHPAKGAKPPRIPALTALSLQPLMDAKVHPRDKRSLAHVVVFSQLKQGWSPARLGGEAGQERHTRSAAEAHQDHSCPSPPVLTLPEWAGSPAGAPGRCHCPGSSSLPGQGIWKWFVEAPGKEWRHLQSPSLSCCSPEPSPSSTASRLIYS